MLRRLLTSSPMETAMQAQSASSEAAIQAMRSPDLYPDRTEPPEEIETHISHLFLTESFVYKLKKSVDFGFLDYSSLEKRKQACQAEVELNRRLAPEIYEGVVPLSRNGEGRWNLGQPGSVPSGEPAEWVVKMKRLPQSLCLQEMIATHCWTPQHLDDIVVLLTRFYRSLPAERPSNYRQRVLQHVRDNQMELEAPQHQFSSPLVRRVHSAQRQFLFLHGELLDERVHRGHVVEGHGDLRAEHLYLTDPPVAIDGIEFSRDLRITDIADELSFFAITCEMQDAAELGEQVLQGVCGSLGDVPRDSLLDFYRSYRACVRAKVELLRSDQTGGPGRRQGVQRAEDFLKIADRYAQQFARPRAIIVRGLSGTGKTTLAEAIADRLGATHLSTDHVRKTNSEQIGLDRYSEPARRKVYAVMYDQALDHLADGVSVVLDGTHLQAELIREETEKIRRAGGQVAVVNCLCPGEVAVERIEQRERTGESDSEADVDVFHKQRELIEMVPPDLVCIEIDTTLDQNLQLETFRTQLLRSGFPSGGQTPAR